MARLRSWRIGCRDCSAGNYFAAIDPEGFTRACWQCGRTFVAGKPSKNSYVPPKPVGIVGSCFADGSFLTVAARIRYRVVVWGVVLRAATRQLLGRRAR